MPRTTSECIGPMVTITLLALGSCASLPPERDTFLCHPGWRSQRCAAVPFAPDETEAQAKQFEPPPAGKARLYIYRPYLQHGMKTSRVLVDDCPAGSIAARSFLVLDLLPGRYRVTIDSGEPVSHQLDAESGAVYYLQYRLDLLLFTVTPVLKRVAERDAQRAIRALELAAASSCAAQ